MADVYVNPIRSRIEGPDIGPLVESFRITLYKYTQRDGNVPDGEHYFVDPLSGEFRTGLLQMVLDRARDYGIQIKVHMLYDLPDVPLHDIEALESDEFEVRPYQVTAISSFVMNDWGRGIWWHATNAGKTKTTGALIYTLDVPTLFIVPMQRTDLLYQAANEFESLGLGDVARFAANAFPYDKQIVCASGATLVARLRDRPEETREWMTQFEDGLLVMDECHEISHTLRGVIDACPAPYRLGLSGTPFVRHRYQDWSTIGQFGPVLDRIDNDFLISQGYSARPYIFRVKYEHSNWRRRFRHREKYHTVVKKAIVENEQRSEFIVRIARRLHELGERVFILVGSAAQSVTYGKKLKEKLESHRLIVPLYRGSTMSSSQRETIREMFTDGRVDMVVANQVFDVGTSLPSITCIINAAGGKLTHHILQRLGRGLRRKADRNAVLWVDIQDECLYLTGHVRERNQIYEASDEFKLINVRGIDEIETYLREYQLLKE